MQSATCGVSLRGARHSMISDAQLACLQILDESDHAGALGRLLEIVVVVVKLHVRVCFARELERLRDVVIADAVSPRRLPE